MKKIFILILLFSSLNCFSQIMQNVIPDRAVFNRSARDTTAMYGYKYDWNLGRVSNMINWISERKKGKIDSIFMHQLDSIYHELQLCYDKNVNFALMDKQINKIDQEIKDAYTKNFQRYQLPDYYASFIIAKSPKEAGCYIRSGLKNWKEKKLEDAYSDIKKAIEIDSTNADFFIYKASLELELNQDNLHAIESLSKAIDLKNSFNDPYLKRAFTYSDSKQFQNALNDINTYLIYYPGNTYALIERSIILSQKGDHLGAMIDCELVEKSITDGTYYSVIELSHYYNSIAWVYFLEKDYNKCIEFADKSLKQDKEQPSTLDTRGCGFYGLGEFEKCISDMNKAIEMYPKSKNSYYYRGLAYIKTDKKELACQDFRMAYKLGEEKALEAIRLYCPQTEK